MENENKVKKKSKLKPIVILLSVVIVTLITLQASGVSAKDIKKKFSKPPEELYLEPFEILTNADINESSRVVVQTKIIVSTMDKTVIDKSEKLSPKIKELLVEYINNQPVSKLRDNSKKDVVKKEIVTLIEKELSLKIKSVYFVEFLSE